MEDIRKPHPIVLGEAEDQDLENNERRLDTLTRALQKAGVGSLKSLKMLEIGCGDANLLRFLRTKHFNITGVEARPRGSNIESVVEARVEDMPFVDSTFDVVFSSLVFDLGAYHQDQRAMMQEIARVLKPGGFYVSRGDEIKVRNRQLRVVVRMNYDIPIKVYRNES